MSAMASVISPFTFSSAVELANRLWRKRILPIGDIEYQGRTLNFTPALYRGPCPGLPRQCL